MSGEGMIPCACALPEAGTVSGGDPVYAAAAQRLRHQLPDFDLAPSVIELIDGVLRAERRAAQTRHDAAADAREEAV